MRGENFHSLEEPTVTIFGIYYDRGDVFVVIAKSLVEQAVPDIVAPAIHIDIPPSTLTGLPAELDDDSGWFGPSTSTKHCDSEEC